MRHYDVAIVADVSCPSDRVVREVTALTRAGYSTAIVPCDSAPSGSPAALTNLLCARDVDVVIPEQSIVARLCLVPPLRDEPAGGLPKTLANIECELALRLASSDEGRAPADVVRVPERFTADGFTADEILVAPTDGLARQALSRRQITGVTARDWGDPMDVDRWRVARGPVVGATTIGRHSDTTTSQDWPATGEEILDAYPHDPRLDVQVMGPDDAVRAVLGYVPGHWTVLGRGARDARRFLSDLDVYVYLCQDGALVKAQRRILEAMASGLPVLLPVVAEPLFGSACRYEVPGEVAGHLAALRDDGALPHLGEISETFAREHHSFQAHARRVYELIGPPQRSRRASRADMHEPGQPRRIAFFTSNGEGMGHLTRLMACARRLPDDFEPVFFTLSSAMAVVQEAGYPCEFIPRQKQWTTKQWNPFLHRRLLELVDEYDVSGLVFDGIAPYRGLIEAMGGLDLPFVWMRRGMWKAGVGARSLEYVNAFQMVIEPGDYAGSADRGLTAGRREETLQVDPITLLDRSELLDRETAIRELDLDASKTRVLVLLGSDSLNDVASRAGIITHELVRHETVEVVFADWLISSRSVELPERVRRRAVYPVSRYLAAFDFAVSAAGYNSYHELLQAGVPTIFTPTRKLRDDQTARAVYAQREGAAIVLHEVTQSAVASSVEMMMDEECRAAMSARALDTYPSNGAQTAADAIATLISQGRDVSLHQGGGPVALA